MWIETVSGTLINVDKIKCFTLVMFSKGHYAIVDNEDDIYCEGTEIECDAFLDNLKPQLQMILKPADFKRGMGKTRKLIDGE